MFASFLDERIQFSDDMDTLLFDEYIRREQGKPAAFLADTSQTHKSRYVCQTPITTGNVTYDSGFPHGWTSTMIPAPRSIDLLVDVSTEFQRATAAGMSYASLKFFMDQKTYSRKLHTISQHCARDDQMFLSIVKNMSEWTTLQRSAVATECKLRLSKLNHGDEFAIADVWNQVCSYVESTQNAKRTETKTMNSLNDDLSEQINFLDREIRILFDESKQLDAEATMRKTELERIKSLLVNARQKLALIEQEARLPADFRKSVSLFRQSDLSRLVAARSEVQALSIEQSEAETGFWTHLDLYNSRIPQIISELQRLNLCRVASLKSALKLLTSSRLEELHQEILVLEILSNSINSINIDEALFQETFPASSIPSISHPEIDSLRAYTPSPVPTPRLGGSESVESPTHSVAKMSQSNVDVALLFRYSVLLWGQFDIVFQHAVQGKAVVKQFSFVVDTASGVFEHVSRSMGKLPKSSVSSRSVSATRSLSSKLQNSSVRYTIRLSDAENAISAQLDALCYEVSQQALQISRRFQQLFVEIRLLKRECKGSFTMIQRRRNKLESDIQAAYEIYHKNSAAGFSTLSTTSLASKSQREIDMLSRQWETAQVQHQLGNAHLLDQFQRIEQLRLTSLKKIMTDFHVTLNDYCTQTREVQGRLLSTIDDINVDSVITEYSSRFLDEQSNKELFDYIGDGIEHVSGLIISMENLVNIDESLSNKTRKVAWSIDIQEAMPSISKALESVSSFFQSWPKAIDKDVMIRRDDIVELRRWRDQWHSKLSIAISKEQVEKKNRDAVLTSYEHARSDLAKAMQTVNQNRERLTKAESESTQPDTGMKLMKFMKTPIDKQRIRLVESQAELEAIHTHCNRLELEKNNAEQKYATTIRSMHSFALEVEQTRLSGLFAAMKKFIQHILQGNDIVIDAVRSLAATVREVDIHSDMASWVDSVRAKTCSECPEVVLRNLERGVEDADLQIPELSDGASTQLSAKHLLLKTTNVALESISTAISGSSSPHQFYTVHNGEDNSLSDESYDDDSKQGRIETEGPESSDLVPPQRARHLNAGVISDASSISTLSD